MAIPRKPLVDPSKWAVVYTCQVEHHTRQKGDPGVLKAQLDLFEQGFVVLNPITEHTPF